MGAPLTAGASLDLPRMDEQDFPGRGNREAGWGWGGWKDGDGPQAASEPGGRVAAGGGPLGDHPAFALVPGLVLTRIPFILSTACLPFLL